MKVVSRNEALQVLNTITNEFFTVVFTKRTNGETRVMNCRKNVKKHLNGGTLAYNPNEKGLVPVFDIQAKGYRMFNFEGLQEVRYGGKVLQVK